MTINIDTIDKIDAEDIDAIDAILGDIATAPSGAESQVPDFLYGHPAIYCIPESPEWQVVSALLSGRGWVREMVNRFDLRYCEFVNFAAGFLFEALVAESPEEARMEGIPDRERADTIDMIDRADLYGADDPLYGQFSFERIVNFSLYWEFRGEREYTVEAAAALWEACEQIRAAYWGRMHRDITVSVGNVLLSREWTPYVDILRQVVHREGFSKVAMDTLLKIWLADGTAEKRVEGGGSFWRVNK